MERECVHGVKRGTFGWINWLMDGEELEELVSGRTEIYTPLAPTLGQPQVGKARDRVGMVMTQAVSCSFDMVFLPRWAWH